MICSDSSPEKSDTYLNVELGSLPTDTETTGLVSGLDKIKLWGGLEPSPELIAISMGTSPPTLLTSNLRHTCHHTLTPSKHLWHRHLWFDSINESAITDAHLYASSSYIQHLALLCAAHFGIALLCQENSHRASSMNYMQQSFSALMMDKILASSAGAHALTHP